MKIYKSRWSRCSALPRVEDTPNACNVQGPFTNLSNSYEIVVLSDSFTFIPGVSAVNGTTIINSITPVWGQRSSPPYPSPCYHDGCCNIGSGKWVENPDASVGDACVMGWRLDGIPPPPYGVFTISNVSQQIFCPDVNGNYNLVTTCPCPMTASQRNECCAVFPKDAAILKFNGPVPPVQSKTTLSIAVPNSTPISVGGFKYLSSIPQLNTMVFISKNDPALQSLLSKYAQVKDGVYSTKPGYQISYSGQYLQGIFMT